MLLGKLVGSGSGSNTVSNRVVFVSAAGRPGQACGSSAAAAAANGGSMRGDHTTRRAQAGGGGSPALSSTHLVQLLDLFCGCVRSIISITGARQEAADSTPRTASGEGCLAPLDFASALPLLPLLGCLGQVHLSGQCRVVYCNYRITLLLRRPKAQKAGPKKKDKCRLLQLRARTATRVRHLAAAHTQAYPRMPKWCVQRPPTTRCAPGSLDGSVVMVAPRKRGGAWSAGPSRPGRFFVAAFFLHV